jgi:hypothetical protein
MSDFSRDELLDRRRCALGATSPETAAIEALPTMPDLAAEISAYTDVTVTLAQQQAMAPSPDVRAVLDGVGASKRLTHIRPPSPRGPDGPSPWCQWSGRIARRCGPV